MAARSGNLRVRQELVRALIGAVDDPRRALRMILVFLLGCQAVLIALHLFSTVVLADLAAQTVDGHIGGFDLESEGSLSVWFSSLQLLLAGVLCLLISWVDRGEGQSIRPLFWRYGSLVFIVMSIDETAVLHEMYGGSMVRFFPQIPLSASLWWALPYGALLGVFMLFLILSVRRRVGLVILTLAGGGLWLISVLLEMIWLLPAWANIALEEGAEMLGATFLVAALGFHLINRATLPADRPPPPSARPVIPPRPTT